MTAVGLLMLVVIFSSYLSWPVNVLCSTRLANDWCFVVMSHVPRLTIETTARTSDLTGPLPNHLCEVVHYLSWNSEKS